MGTTAISDFIPVCISTLQPASSPGVNLFQREIEGSDFVLYCAENHPILPEDLVRLKERGIKELFITSASRDSYQAYLRGLIESSEGSSDENITARTSALNEVVRDVLEASFRGGDLENTIATASNMGAITADIVCNDKFATGDLFRVLHHDYATFTHSANVAFYAGMLAAELGLRQHDVEQITTGGLLHDLGKLAIDDRILSKPGRLTDDEFRIIKMHPTWGFDQLNHRDDLSRGQLMMVYQHHERIDGNGYPVGVIDGEIHEWAKICAVVDVFEAMTSFRPYRGPMPKPLVIEIMEKDSGTAFDPEVLACWVKITRAFWKI